MSEQQQKPKSFMQELDQWEAPLLPAGHQRLPAPRRGRPVTRHETKRQTGEKRENTQGAAPPGQKGVSKMKHKLSDLAIGVLAAGLALLLGLLTPG